MALVLGVENGERFFIGRRQLEVVSIDSPGRITLRRDDGRMFTVTRHGITEVFKDVFICTGPWQRAARPRLVFDAPQTVLIQRARQDARPDGATFNPYSGPARVPEISQPRRRSP